MTFDELDISLQTLMQALRKKATKTASNPDYTDLMMNAHKLDEVRVSLKRVFWNGEQRRENERNAG